jgi:hypothetical protein
MKNSKQEQRHESAWKEHLNRWGAYAAVTGAALAMSTNADADIIYSGTQNITVSNSTKQFQIGPTLAAKITNRYGTILGFLRFGEAALKQVGPSVNFFVASGVAKNYATGQPIGGGSLSKLGILRSAQNTTGPAPPSNPRGSFSGGFVGFEASGDRLGWIHVEVVSEIYGYYPNEVEVIDWAYNQTAGAPINAGQTSDGTSPAPEPGMAALGFLASGAAGLLAWRKRRAQLRTKPRP